MNIYSNLSRIVVRHSEELKARRENPTRFMLVFFLDCHRHISCAFAMTACCHSEDERSKASEDVRIQRIEISCSGLDCHGYFQSQQ